jgi:hypothetical protein
MEVARCDLPWDDLFVLGCRYNPRRGYLFVSKVLGKHWPAAPSAMGGIHGMLAERLAALGLPKPLVLVAMAETAVGLGRGVFDRYSALADADGLLFLQTTRRRLAAPVLLTSDEPHCHAPAHTVYVPQGDPEKGRILRGARSVVLVDDEITTGKTLRGLAAGLARAATCVRRVVMCSIASFLGPAGDGEGDAGLPRAARGSPDVVTGRPEASGVSLLEGRFSFRKTSDLPAPAGIRSEGGGGEEGAVALERGRLGLLPGEGLPDVGRAISGLGLPDGAPVRVIGTGEFLHEPYLLARELEARGHRVVFQSTTRTPAAVAAGIAHAWRFKDNYGEGLDNFLYNAPPGFEGETVVCRETVSSPPGFDIAGRLGAREILL